jgi:uncharacterized surface protein with fasciclin (FAS1) repeats
MKLRRTIAAASAAITLTVGLGLGLAPAAQAAEPTGTQSLATVLAQDTSGFDHRSRDFDILTAAVQAVLAAKPSSPVAVLADGNVPLTAFLPTDKAFRVLAFDLTHHWYRSEADVFNALAAKVGIDGIEQVLLYHVVPGVTIDSRTARASDGAVLKTAQGGTIRVDVVRHGNVRLVDNAPHVPDPYLVRGELNINKGNVQIAHAISRVLLPNDV